MKSFLLGEPLEARSLNIIVSKGASQNFPFEERRVALSDLTFGDG